MSAGERDLPVHARPVAYALLALLVASIGLGVEWWPLSAFELFSRVRTGTSTSWEVRRTDRAGATHPIDVSIFGRGYRGAHHLLPRLAPDEQEEVCDAWRAAARRRGLDVSGGLSVYRVTRTVPTRAGAAPDEIGRRLQFSCPGGGPSS